MGRAEHARAPLASHGAGQCTERSAVRPAVVAAGRRHGNNGAPNTLRAWTQITTGSANSLVAVLDNGIVDHPDLAGKVIRGVDMVQDTTFSNDGDGRDTEPADPGDWVDSGDLALPAYAGCKSGASSWHGTVIAGMLAAQANNGQGGASMNWPGRVLAVRVAAKCGADVADIVDGMRWAAGFDDVCRRSDTAGNCLDFLRPTRTRCASSTSASAATAPAMPIGQRSMPCAVAASLLWRRPATKTQARRGRPSARA